MSLLSQINYNAARRIRSCRGRRAAPPEGDCLGQQHGFLQRLPGVSRTALGEGAGCRCPGAGAARVPKAEARPRCPAPATAGHSPDPQPGAGRREGKKGRKGPASPEGRGGGGTAGAPAAGLPRRIPAGAGEQ